MKITLGPILYFWPKAKVFEFYETIADSPVDTVVLGEAVCSKRRELRADDWAHIGRTLTAAGKQVALTTLPLIESAAELGVLRRACRNEHFLVEANDMGAVYQLHRNQRPFIAGATLNIYHPRSLQLMQQLGARRWTPPLEMSGEQLHSILTEAGDDAPETEVFAYGHLPLAWSARCFTARHHDLPKDDCRFRCIEDEEGILTTTRDGEPFLTINGIQTQSAHRQNLLPYVDEMRRIGVRHLRLSPQATGMGEVIDAFHTAISGGEINELGRHGPFHDGYWLGEAGMV